jgi:cytoskeletal protein RodZ
MKRCPECYEVYDDQQRFCETDGHELLADPAVVPKAEVVVPAPSARAVWWPAAALGILIGVIFGAGVFAVALFVSTPESNQRSVASPAAEAPVRALPNRAVAASNSVPTPEPSASPSPDPEQAETEPSPAPNTENKTASVPLNEGPISTGQKTNSSEGDSAQTVIEMTDGSTLDVDAAWEDKQGIWYRRSGLVSFVDSSRVKAITARRETKVADGPHR